MELLLAAVGILGGGGMLLWLAVRSQGGGEHHIPHPPRTAIAEVSEGHAARIVGKVVPGGEMLVAPLSGRPCVHYVVVVDRVTVMDRTAWVLEDLGAWRAPPAERLIAEERGTPFVVADDTGRAVVDPAGAITALHQDWHRLSEVDVLGPIEREFLARRGLSAHIWRPLSFREAIVEAGDRVSVQGVAVREPDPGRDAGYREPAWRLRLAARFGTRLYLSDRADLVD